MRSYTNRNAPSKFTTDQGFYERLRNFFLLGETYYFILNHQSLSIEFMSKDVEKILGYPVSCFDMAFLNEKIHPDDKSWFLSFGACIVDFFSKLAKDKLMKYKVRYDLRIQKSDGSYSRILYQGILIEHDEKGGFLRTMNVNTDISYLKKEGTPVLSFLGMDDEPSYYDVALNNLFEHSREDLTPREKQVLKLLVEGRLSKEISHILKISKQTVDTHRKNMIHKKNLHNTSELIGKAIRSGWI
jgi:DNA-binding CsgD family transcriptional regulator